MKIKPAAAKTCSAHITERKTKRKSLDYENNGKMLNYFKQMSDNL